MTRKQKRSLNRHLGALVILASIAAIIGAQTGSARDPQPNVPTPTRVSNKSLSAYEQQIREDVSGAIRINAEAANYREWISSGFTPAEVIRNVAAFHSAEAWNSFCASLTDLPNEDLALFEDSLDLPLNRMRIHCAAALSSRVKSYWGTTQLVLSRKLKNSSSPLKTEERPVGSAVMEGEVVITLDGGPHPTRTRKILASLKKKGVRAHFFAAGLHARRWPDVVAETATAGHVVASEAWERVDLDSLPTRNSFESIRKGRETVKTVSGQNTPFFRFPMDSDSEALRDFVKSQGLTSISSDIDSQDWKLRNPQALLDHAIQALDEHKGGIISFSDIQEQSAIVMPYFLEVLRARGYKTVVFVPR
jgi:peptidoglycan/xylan/chitin deacetylase (PgdA/CDA1 family)